MSKFNAIIAAVVCTTSLFAAPAAFAKSNFVQYNDLDLSTVAGQDALQDRLEQAARKVCEYHRPTTGTLLPDRHQQECYKQAMAQTKQQVAAAIAAQTGDTPRLGG